MVFANQHLKFAKCINDLTATAIYQTVSLTISEMKKLTDEQNAPSGYGVMNIMNDGKVVADHYKSRTQFQNILKNVIS